MEILSVVIFSTRPGLRGLPVIPSQCSEIFPIRSTCHYSDGSLFENDGKYFGTLRRRNNEASELRAGPAGKLPLQWFLFTKAHFCLCYSPQTNAKPLGGTDALPIICIHLGDGRPNKCQHSNCCRLSRK